MIVLTQDKVRTSKPKGILHEKGSTWPGNSFGEQRRYSSPNPSPKGQRVGEMSPLYLSRIKENQEPGGAPGES
jgi:hypothetical protein